jgi:predicted nuclease with TOPRIM domain
MGKATPMSEAIAEIEREYEKSFDVMLKQLIAKDEEIKSLHTAYNALEEMYFRLEDELKSLKKKVKP